jgi:ABC-type bacteriocin/lantibiotic exporter with double-glycine peptidase domain
MYALVLIRESLVVSFIFFLLLFTAPEITAFTSLFLLIFFMIWVLFIRKRIYKIGEISKESRSKFYKNLNESFNSFKEIKIFSIESKVIKEFIKNFSLSEKHVLTESFIGKLPRLILETIVILLMSIILVFYFVDQSGKIQNNLGTIILLSIAVIRLIPSFSTLSSSFLKMRFTKPALEAIYKERLDQKIIPKNEVERNFKFKKIEKLRLDNISFSYDEKNNIIQNLNLEIKKGDKILIQGESGLGKTTLINLISGLLKPSKGKILLNDCDEEQLLGNINIGYVSQNVYLIDESIENNIKFNSNVNDENILNEVINICKVSSFLNKTRNQKFIVGEAGSMLSGGQRQRIALARALYNEPDLLILDEGTSGIDPQMEKEILNQIINKNKDMILIVISHRKIEESAFSKKILIKKDNIQVEL